MQTVQQTARHTDVKNIHKNKVVVAVVGYRHIQTHLPTHIKNWLIILLRTVLELWRQEYCCAKSSQ